MYVCIKINHRLAEITDFDHVCITVNMCNYNLHAKN